MDCRIFCGIEGGASVSKLVLINEKGKLLTSVDGPSTNHLLVGMQECKKRLHDMIEEAKTKAGLPPTTVLDGLGLSMSGCEMEESNIAFEKDFLKHYPSVTNNCKVVSDTIGALLTASPKGGLVLILGTGSNALLLNPDGTTARCGGWGHLIGDEASAIWISVRAVKTIFDAEDNFASPPYDTTVVKQVILEYFGVHDKFGLLEHCYVNFNKSFFAGLCEKLAKAAIEQDDGLCKYLFREAGRVLAKMMIAVEPKVQKELLACDGGLPVVCVGSVFKSWDLLRPGFEQCLPRNFFEFSLMTLNCSAAIGAAYLGAKACGIELPLDVKKNTSLLHHHKTLNVS